MFGGADPSIRDLVPSDITIRGNHITRPLEWKGKWQVKNLLETKSVRRMGKAKADSFFRAFRVVGWVEDPSAASDEPIITPMATGNNGYGKPALGYLALKELLGDARYKKALHTYMTIGSGLGDRIPEV